jgi:hypothetical protein
MVNVKEDSNKQPTDLKENLNNKESKFKNGKPFISKQ